MGPMYTETPYINVLHLFWDSFERFSHQNIFPLWSLLSLVNIIISTVISGPMYLETPYIIISRVINSHMGTIYIETPDITISRIINNHICLTYYWYTLYYYQ